MLAVGLFFVSRVTTYASELRPLAEMSYLQTSEKTPYPDVKNVADLNVLVKIKRNRVFIRSGNQTLYTMYCSAGKINPKTGKSSTPTGHFKIQSERGDSFYNQSLHEGANNWTSFKDHGVYLFHSVPTDARGSYKAREGDKLGHRPASHGCIRLSVPDSLWFKDHIPTGTPVTIKK